MDLYHLALFVHLLTLVVAAGLTTIVKLAATRRMRARTAGEALEWHNTLTSAAKLFPACLVGFTATGFYMLSLTGGAHLSVGYVAAGLLGVLFLLGSGTYLGVQGAGLKRVLEDAAARDADAAPPRLIPSAAVRLLPMINSGVALGVAFDMTTKPASIPVAMGIVVLGALIAAVGASRQGAPGQAGVRHAAM